MREACTIRRLGLGARETCECALGLKRRSLEGRKELSEVVLEEVLFVDLGSVEVALRSRWQGQRGVGKAQGQGRQVGELGER